MSFDIFKNAVEMNLKYMQNQQLFRSSVSKDELWDTYISSFPEGTNPIFRERTEHDCNCCRNFIKNVGDAVVFSKDGIMSIWDIEVPEPYQTVANALSKLVKSKKIENIYLSVMPSYGSISNKDSVSNIIWNHFHAKLKSKYVMASDSIGSYLGNTSTNKNVFERSLTEISEDAVNIVEDLINQKSIYRGEEHKKTIILLKKCLREYKDSKNKDAYLWNTSFDLKDASRIKNTVIGTLLIDISNGIDIEDAVKMFESKVAPQNYKRPTAIITKGMIAEAQKQVEKLGILNSLSRRHASINDITVNNVLFVDRSVKQKMNIFDDLKKKVSTPKKSFDKVEEISIDDFISNVLPTCETIEAYFKSSDKKNLVTLIAPSDNTAPNILKWDNNFSWTYNGDATDSIDERVKEAGGSIEGFMRLSLSWDGTDDLDIHVKTPKNSVIYYGTRGKSIDGGKLDVDANGCSGIMKNPIENVVWENEPPKGIYSVLVDNFSTRSKNKGFDLKLVIGNDSLIISYDKYFPERKKEVLKFEYLGNGEFNILHNLYDLNSYNSKVDIWNISSNEFHKVNIMMLSPNHWDDNNIGNKHYMFMLDECKNPYDVRGFYNEFLRNDLNKHRKVFESLASNMKAAYNENQLSGLGFSSTNKGELIVKVSGSFNRILKVKF